MLVVKYGGAETTFKVTVKDYVKDILVNPIAVTGALKDTIEDIFDDNTITYTVKYASGTNVGPNPVTKEMITNAASFDGESTTAQELKFNHRDTKAESVTFGTDVEGKFTVTLQDGIKRVTLLTPPNKLDYKYGEKLILTGGELEVETNSGTVTTVPLDESMITGYNPNKLNKQTVTVMYNGEFVDTFEVTVEDYIDKLNIIAPEKKTYVIGEKINLEGAKVQVIMASGEIAEETDITEDMITGFDTDTEGTKTVTVTYKDMTGTFDISVGDVVTGIVLISGPNKTVYEYGENLDVTGAKIMIMKSSGTSTIPVTNEMISGYNKNNPGVQTITVTYEGFTAVFMVQVKEEQKNNNRRNTK